MKPLDKNSPPFRIVFAPRMFLRFIGRRAAIWLFVGVVTGVLQGFVEIGLSAFLQLFLRTAGILDATVSLPRVIQHWTPTVVELVLVLIFIGTLRGLNQFFLLLSSSAANEQVVYRLRIVLITKILGGKYQEFLPAHVSQTLLAEIFPRAAAVCFHIVQIIPNTLTALIVLALMMRIALYETILALVGMLVFGLGVKYINKTIRRVAEKIPAEFSRLANAIERVARNWLLVKILRTESHELKEMYGSIWRYKTLVVKSVTLSHVVGVFPSAIGVYLIAAIIGFSMTYLDTPGLSLVTFLYLFMRFVQTVAAMATSSAYVHTSWAHFTEAWTFFFANTSINAGAIGSRIDAEHGKLSENPRSNRHFEPEKFAAENKMLSPPDIVIQDMSFSYSDKHGTAVEIANLEVKSGQHLGLHGLSGSGKSTLLLLILGILDPTKGRIRIGGKKPSEYFTDRSIRVGYVGVDPYVIEGSVKANLSYGVAGTVSDDACWAALDRANLSAAIKEKGFGLDYRLREDGSGLSAGQKQRLALARAFLSKPQILILDEATANLDSRNQEEIMDAVASLRGHTTCVIVSHQPTVLTHVDCKIELPSNSK